MQLGVAASVFGRNKFLTPGDLALLREAGVDYLEISFLHRRLDYGNERSMDELVEAVRKLNIRVQSVHALGGVYGEGVDPSALAEDKRRWSVEKIQIGADLLSRLGGRFLVVHASGSLDELEDRDTRMERAAQSLWELVGYCAPKGIVIAVENLPGDRLCNSLEELRALVERFAPHEVGICYDSGHANLMGDPVAAFRRIQDRVVTFHISDNDGLQDDHAFPLTGTVRWPAFMEALRESGYDGIFTYETQARKSARAELEEIKRNYARLVGGGQP
jgi:sugar phosphate isomerase/epimerase